MVGIHYRWDFIGLSTDQKPTPQTSEKVVNGSTFYCSDNSKLYVFCDGTWYERKALGGGGGGGSYTAGNGIDITDDTISVDTTTIQEKLTAGSNVTISDNTISATNTTYSAGTGLTLTGTEFSADTTVLATQNDLSSKQDTLTAGSNITISDNTISATDTTYSAFTGTDGTAAGTAGLVPAPATTDAGKFLKADGTWDTAGGGTSYTAGDGIDITNAVISATNTGKAKILTTDDYNYPTSNPDGVALWQLGPGLYSVGDNVSVYLGAGGGYKRTIKAVYLVGVGGTGTDTVWAIRVANESLTKNVTSLIMMRADGSSASEQRLLNASTITNDLTSTATNEVLSAKQGKVLKDLVDSLAVRGAGAPTTSTVGQVGTLYEDTTNGKLYICTDATNPYVWEEVGAGGSGPTVVQTTGTSTTDVMSQNATTSMIYADPSTKYKVQIGGRAYASGSYATAVGELSSATGTQSVALGLNAASKANYSVNLGAHSGNTEDTAYANTTAIGYNSVATGGVGAVAVGAYSKTSAAGEMNIGSTNTSYGYNSSNYRLLTGLYDPQSAHDAATKGYVDPTTDASAPTTATVGRLGQIQIDTTNADAYMCVAVDTVTPSYTWKKINV